MLIWTNLIGFQGLIRVATIIFCWAELSLFWYEVEWLKIKWQMCVVGLQLFRYMPTPLTPTQIRLSHSFRIPSNTHLLYQNFHQFGLSIQQ